MRKRIIKACIFVSFLSASLPCSTIITIALEADKPNPKVDYVAKLNELAKADRPENLNAVPHYEKAFELAVQQPEQLKKLDHKIWPADLSTEQREALQTWVQQNAQALKHLKKGTNRLHYWHKHHGNTMAGIVLPELWQARVLAIALCSRAKLNAAKGNFKEAFSDLLVCYRFGLHFTGTKTLIEQLVGKGSRALAVNTSFQILDKRKADSNLLKDFQQKLQKLSSQERIGVDFTAEKFFVCDIIQRIFTDDGKGGGNIPRVSAEQIVNPPEHLDPFLLEVLSKLTEQQRRDWGKMERRQTMQLTDKVYEYLNTAAQKTPAQVRKEGKDLEQAVKEVTKVNPMLSILAPAQARVVDMLYRTETETEALVTVLALLRHKADTGHFPTTLVKLVLTGYLQKLPMDPYSDKPLIYKRTKGNFILYSFGADFDDDGGVPSKWGEGEKGGDQVFWPVQPIQKPKDNLKEK